MGEVTFFKIELTCDNGFCEGDPDKIKNIFEGETEKEVRANAKHFGWQPKRPLGWFCPACNTGMKEEEKRNFRMLPYTKVHGGTFILPVAGE